MITIRFYKENTGRWYADLPTYPGEKSELEMVLGADKMLDFYAQEENEITLTLSSIPLQGLCDIITLENLGLPKTLDQTFYDDNEINLGATYKVHSIKLIDFDFNLWLCPVTLFVFGEYPQNIYIT